LVGMALSIKRSVKSRVKSGVFSFGHAEG
jgi:hypothetical protein